MNAIERTIGDLIVVDANLLDYDSLVIEPALEEARVSSFSTGEDALRAIDAGPATLWIVNMQLPDMSGIGFLSLVRRRQRRSSIILVGDAYSPGDELAARLAGATAYVCKPASAAWIKGHYPQRRSPAVRAGPAFSHQREHT